MLVLVLLFLGLLAICLLAVWEEGDDENGRHRRCGRCRECCACLDGVMWGTLHKCDCDTKEPT